MHSDRRPARQHGITMVESLVALVVLSVGMLGIAGLYVSSLKAGRSALVRTQAVNLVNDMADRIRANALGRDDYDVAGYGGSLGLHDCVETANCTPDEPRRGRPRALDRHRAGNAPRGNPTADVQFTAAAAAGRPDQYDIFVDWQEPGETERFSYTATVQLIPVTP